MMRGDLKVWSRETDEYLVVGKFQTQPRDISYFADVMIHDFRQIETLISSHNQMPCNVRCVVQGAFTFIRIHSS